MNPTVRNNAFDVIETLVSIGEVEGSSDYPSWDDWAPVSMDWMVSPIPSKETLRFVFVTLHAFEGKLKGTFGKKLDKCLDDFMCEFTPEDVD
jgi:hypothetical protein